MTTSMRFLALWKQEGSLAGSPKSNIGDGACVDPLITHVFNSFALPG